MAKKGLSPADIGGVSVGITGDNSGLKQALKESEALTRQAAGQMELSTEQAIQKQVKSASKLVGIYTKLAGVAGALVASFRAVGTAIEYVNNVFGDGSKKAQEFSASIGEATGDNAQNRVNDLTKRLDELNSEIAWANEHPLRFTVEGRSRKTIEDEREEIRRQLIGARKQTEVVATRQKQEERRVATIKSVEEAERAASHYRRQNLEAEQRQLEEYEALLNKFLSLRAQAKQTGDDSLIQRMTDAIEALKEAESDRRRKQNEEADRQARRAADEMRKVMQQFTRDFFREFRNEINKVSPDIRAIGPKLDLLNRNVNRKQ